MHQCQKMFDENGNFKRVTNGNAPRFKGCFMGLQNGAPAYPWFYCTTCIMSDPDTGACERVRIPKNYLTMKPRGSTPDIPEYFEG